MVNRGLPCLLWERICLILWILDTPGKKDAGWNEVGVGGQVVEHPLRERGLEDGWSEELREGEQEEGQLVECK